MGKPLIKFKIDQVADVTRVEFTAPDALSAQHVSAAEVRRTMEESLHHIPDGALKGIKSFKIMVEPAVAR